MRSVLKISTYIINSIITRHTGHATILAIMFVSTFKTAVIIYVDFKGGNKMKTIGISAMLSARYQSKEIISV
jgi:hypothetical protein